MYSDYAFLSVFIKERLSPLDISALPISLRKQAFLLKAYKLDWIGFIMNENS